MFFVNFRREITEKGFKRTKQVENDWKKVVWPAFRCCKHLQAGRNTQQPRDINPVEAEFFIMDKLITINSIQVGKPCMDVRRFQLWRYWMVLMIRFILNKLSRGEICVANFILLLIVWVRVIISWQKFQKWLFLRQKRADRNCGGTQTCKLFYKWYILGQKVGFLALWPGHTSPLSRKQKFLGYDFLTKLSQKKFQPILFCQSWDNLGRNS